MRFAYAVSLTLCLLFTTAARGQVVVPGADGSDGAFSPASNTVVNLANSPTAAWNGANPDPGTPLTGVYDPDKWAVVFRFSSVNIPSNVTVTFTNHPSRAPVVWLVSGDVTVAGTINLNGSNGNSSQPSNAGPGGFRGGGGFASAQAQGCAGFGPGGGSWRTNTWGCSSHATQGCTGVNAGSTYGNTAILPLIGGSGGPGHWNLTYGGGGGGGGILVASGASILINGSVQANGGNANPGSCGGHFAVDGTGGAIRLVANSVSGAGSLAATPIGCATGGMGRIRVERNTGSLSGTLNPAPSFALPGVSATLWPDAAPTIKATLLDGLAVPADPRASLDFPAADVMLTNPNPVTLQLTCENVPVNSTVSVRIIPRRGADTTVNATFVSGDVNNSIWQAQVQLPDGHTAIQARAVLP